MATLAEALQGLNYTGADTGYGIAATTLGQMTPQLINPYGSTGQAVGISLGSVLLQSLLGYQARQQAASDTLELNTLANQLMTKTTPEARTEFIGGVSEPGYQSRLSTLSTALMQQEAARKAKAAEKLLELETEAGFELGPKGTELFKRKQQAELERALAARPPRIIPEEKDWFEKLSTDQRTAVSGVMGQSEQLKQLANKFRQLDLNAVELGAMKQIPGSEADLALSAMQTLVPSTVKMLGDTGALSAYDQEAVRKATLGGITSGSKSIADRLDQLANMAKTKVTETMKAQKLGFTSGGDVLLQQLEAEQKQDPTQARKEELRKQIAEMKVLLEQRRK